MPETDEQIDEVEFQCLFDFESKKSNWILQYNGTNITEIPQCEIYCSTDPPSAPSDLHERNWDKSHWSDSEMSFICNNGMLKICAS